VFNNFDAKRYTISFTVLTSNRVIVLESIVQSQYRGDEIPYPPFLRTLQTEADLKTFANMETKSGKVQSLEAPNIIDGLAAAILTRCQMFGKCGAILVSLEENHILESDTLRAYEGCILKIFKMQSKGNIDYKSVLSKLKGRKINPLFL
jgi:hypothetical protein